MTKLTKSIGIEASPEKIWAFIFDLKKMNELTRGSSEGEYTSKGPIGVGTTIHYGGKAGGSEAEFNTEITELEKNKKASMQTVGGSKFKMQGSYTPEPTSKGTRLTTTYDYELPYSILGKIVDKLKVSKDMEKMSEKQLGSMKKALET